MHHAVYAKLLEELPILLTEVLNRQYLGLPPHAKLGTPPCHPPSPSHFSSSVFVGLHSLPSILYSKA